jgi:hypothetical protein
VTVTETSAAMNKREAQPMPDPTTPPILKRATLEETIVALEQFQDGNINSSVLLSWAPEIASACSCQDGGALFTSTILDVVTTTV